MFLRVSSLMCASTVDANARSRRSLQGPSTQCGVVYPHRALLPNHRIEVSRMKANAASRKRRTTSPRRASRKGAHAFTESTRWYQGPVANSRSQRVSSARSATSSRCSRASTAGTESRRSASCRVPLQCCLSRVAREITRSGGGVHEIGLEHRSGALQRGQRVIDPSDRGAIASPHRGVGRLGDENRPEDHERARHLSSLCRLRRSGTARRSAEKGTGSRRHLRRTSRPGAGSSAGPRVR